MEHISDSALFTITLLMMAVLMVPLAMTMYRMLVDARCVNNLVATDMLTALTIAAGTLATVGTGWRGFLDMSFGIALVGFVGTCLSALLLKRRGRKK